MDQVFRSLQQLQCPFPYDNKTLLELRWNELLGWLLQAYDSKTFDRLVDTSTNSPDCMFQFIHLLRSFTTQKLQSHRSKCLKYSHITPNKISDRSTFQDLNLFVLLGLCTAKDAPLIRGTAKLQDKVEFLRDFTELVVLNTSQTSTNIAPSQRLLSDIVSDAKAILSPQITLFSSDMDPIYAVKPSTIPPIDLESLISCVKTELADVSIKLATMDVTDLQLVPVSKRTDIDGLKKEVHTQFVRLQKVMERFDSVYELEIKPWMRDEPDVKLVGIGPESSRILNLQKSLQLALSSVRQLKNGYQQIVSNESSSELSKIDLEINEHAILAVQDQCSILEKAIARRHEAGLLSE
jgi:hypothetical protein